MGAKRRIQFTRKSRKIHESVIRKRKMKNSMPLPYSKKMKMAVDSDFYFNNPDKVKEMKEYSEVYPYDNQGACVPEGKSIENLKKTEASIQERFDLKTVGGEE